MLVTLILDKRGNPITLGVGRFCFPIENGELQHATDQKNGSSYYNKTHEYDEAYDLAVFCWENQVFDKKIFNYLE